MPVSDKPWSGFTAADYNPAQWRRACLIDTGEGDPDSKSRYKLPVKEPDGAISRAGAHAAASVLAGGRGGVQASSEQKAAAARKLVAIYRNDLKEDPPDSLLRLAGNRQRGNVMAELERRYTPGLVEARAVGDGSRIAGYGSVFGKLSRNLGGFVERVDGTAFNKSRADGWPAVVARYNHDSNMVLGTTAGRTLELRVDETGLWYEVLPPKARGDILELVSRGDVQHSSFAFRVPPGGDEWAVTDQNYPMRVLREVQLVDVAPVLDPAYPDATAGLRSLAEHVGADLDEVRSMAAADDLRRFFVRTDDTGPKKTPAMSAAAAAVALLARREDPYQ